MKRIFLGVILSFCAMVQSFAYDISVSGRYYQITNDTTYHLVCPLEDHYYIPYISRDIEIPDNVTYNVKSRSVTSIGDYAFEGY